jgi:hypothetical protein
MFSRDYQKKMKSALTRIKKSEKIMPEQIEPAAQQQIFT